MATVSLDAPYTTLATTRLRYIFHVSVRPIAALSTESNQ